MNGSPCLNCEDRELGCHDRCDKYQAYRTMVDLVREKGKANNDANNHMYDTMDRMAGAGRRVY